jgi:Do/DeqQ family serine protease
MRKLIITGLMIALASLPVAAQEKVPLGEGEIKLTFAPIVRATSPAVVNVYAQRMVASRQYGGLFEDPFFRQFFGDDNFGRPRARTQNSLGSGVIVDAEGLIVTNNHVIRGGSEIRVVLADKREFEAKVVLTDERTDLAILKIDAGEEALPALELANSDDLDVGDLVLAIGNPFGVGQTVTSGIVSALARTDVGVSDYQFFIQTDAAINPGNSGGALIDMQGRLIGVNTAIFSRSGGSIGIGFAIPSNMVRTVVLSAEKGEKVRRPWIGADLQDVTADIAESLGLARPEGALIATLNEGSPLAAAGLKRGDVILALDGKAIENAKEFGYRVATAEIGGSGMVEYQRGGTRKETRLRFIAAPETVARAETAIEGRSPFTGLVVANLSPAVADELGLGAEATGVAVTEVKGGPARRFFRKGDIILEVNGTPIDSVATLEQANAAADGYWEFSVNRRGRVLRLRLGG